jgi:hypothetical protein
MIISLDRDNLELFVAPVKEEEKFLQSQWAPLHVAFTPFLIDFQEVFALEC